MTTTERVTAGLARGTDQSGKAIARAVAQATSAGSPSAASADDRPASSTSEDSGVFARMGDVIARAIDLEQQVSAPVAAAVSVPAYPALRVGDQDIGLPHAHNHPPNLVPPNPAPVPLPSTGPVVALPFISGATQTFIEGAPAARCGDLGMGVWCGGFFPMFEVFFGSASVWIEGSRQARMGIDLTNHCIFSAPRPNDPPMGPVVGTTVSGASKTLVGGVPMPSLTALGMGAAFKGLVKGAGSLVSRAKARPALERFLKVIVIDGDDGFKAALMKDLHRVARTTKGRQMMDDIARSGHGIEFTSPKKSWSAGAAFKKHGPHCMSFSDEGHVRVSPDPNGPYLAKYSDNSELRTRIDGPGQGSSSQIVYDPEAWNARGRKHPGSPSDVVLAHEMNHATNNVKGNGRAALSDPDPEWNKAWKNYEEADTVSAENQYRAERGGVPMRANYSDLP